MFLGIHQDYRNNFDISNDVASFGQYIDWHRDDHLKERTLVYAPFPLVQSVPRDMVFGQYANVGGVRQSWTAACYVLTADFADVMPADEDQMPVDRNPHHLPGNLQHMMNNVVIPPYPEIWWNEIPQAAAQGEPLGGQQDDPLVIEEVVVQPAEEEVIQDNIVMGSSESSSSVQFMDEFVSSFDEVGMHSMEQPASVSQITENTVRDLVVYNPLQMPQLPQTELQVQRATPVFGPQLPPDMLFKRLFQSWLPELLTTNVHVAMRSAAFSLLLTKRIYAHAFEQHISFQLDGRVQSQHRLLISPARHSVARCLCFTDEGTSSAPQIPAIFQASPGVSVQKKKRGKDKKWDTPLVGTSVRRCTRSMLKNDGYRPAPVLEEPVKPPTKRVKKQS
jgi:hypothetical protein